MSKWMPINEPQRVKSRQLPDAAWDQRRTDLVARYESGGKHGVKSAYDWILEQNDPDFQPTRRQLETRLSIWKVKETHVRGAGAPEPFTTTIVSLPSPPADTNWDGICSRCGPSMIGSTVSNQLCPEELFMDDSGSKTPTDSSTRNVSLVASRTLFEREIQIYPCVSHSQSIADANASILAPVDTFQTLQVIQKHAENLRDLAQWPKRPWENFAMTRMHGSTVPDPVDFSNGCEPDDHDTIGLFLSFTTPAYIPQLKRRLGSTLASIRIHVTSEQIEGLAVGNVSHNLFSPGDQHIIEEAAYFFEITRVDPDAYVLYYVLWILNNNSPGHSEHRLGLLKSCVVAANTIEDLDHILRLLAGEVKNVQQLGNTDMEVTLLRVVLAFAYKRKGYLELMKEQLWKAMWTFSDIDCFIRKFCEAVDDPQQTVQFDFNSYHILDFAFRILDDPFNDLASIPSSSKSKPANFDEMIEQVRRKNLGLLSDQFLGRSTGSFGLREALTQDSYLRKWANWCHRSMQARKALIDHLQVWNTMSQDHHIKVSSELVICCLLWTRWQEARHLSIPSERDSPWDSPMVARMGIPAPTIISGFVRMSFQEVRMNVECSSMSPFSDNLSSGALNHCLDRFSTLSKMSDEQLIGAFLDSLMQNPCSSSQVGRQQGDPLSEIGLKTLMIPTFIAGIERRHLQSESGITLHQRRTSALTIVSRDPTMCSSETGSTISSLRRHARKFARVSGAPITASEFGWSQTSSDDSPHSMSLMTDLNLLAEVGSSEQ